MSPPAVAKKFTSLAEAAPWLVGSLKMFEYAVMDVGSADTGQYAPRFKLLADGDEVALQPPSPGPGMIAGRFAGLFNVSQSN